MNPTWSYVLTLIGVTGLLLAGRKQHTGWLIGLLAQIPWATYGVVTSQHGFILSAAVYGYVYAHNYWSWRQGGHENITELREAAAMWEKVRPHVEDIINSAPVDVNTTREQLAALTRTQGVLQNIISTHQREENTP
ncbi:hypothetical protein [Streptomyces sp. NPDC018055]|uniref:hypothetical protein n=1 Tax=Streptomyces sp. NPDC018055 TaxID=3365038 RepID=UPI00379DFEE2